jgi:beta-lactamase regulating signal transducer with metallopeptidase domain
VLTATLIGNTAVGLILASAAMVAMRLNRPAAAHVLWLLVIVKLLTPPLVPVSVTSETPAVGPQVVEPITEVPVAATSSPSVAIAAPKVAASSPPVVRSDAPVSTKPICLPCVLGAIWIAGSLAWAALLVVRIARFSRVLKRSQPASDDLRNEVDVVSDRIGLRRSPEIQLVDAAVSPLLWFVGGRVSLVLPRSLVASMSPSQREGVIAHELAHLRRRDHWVRLLEIVATAALWWHPLLWLARRGLHEAEEQCCDAWVVAMRSDADARRTYADALVDALEFVSSRGAVALPAGATGLGRVKHLKRRVTMILTSVPRKSLSGVGKLALTVIVVAAVPLMPVRGQAQPADPNGIFAEAPSSAPATQKTVVDEETHRAVTALIEAAAQDSDNAVKNASNAAIRQFGPRAVPALIDAVGNPSLAETARGQLGQLGPDSFDPLLDALSSRDARVRTEALTAMAQILSSHLGMPPGAGRGGYGGGGGGGFAGGMEGRVSTVAGVIGNEIPDVTKRMTAAVIKATRDADVGVRRAAVRVLGQLAPQAAMAGQLETVMPSVLAAMKDADAEVRSGAAWVVTTIGPAATGAIDALTAAAKDEDTTVRYSAMHALKTMGPSAKAATPAVIAALKDPQPTVRAAAAEALGSIQSPPQPAPGLPSDPAAAPQ